MNTTDGITTIIEDNSNAIETYEYSNPDMPTPIKRIRVVVLDKNTYEVKQISFPYRVYIDIIKARQVAEENCRMHSFHRMPTSYRVRRTGEGIYTRYEVTPLFSKEKIAIADPEKTLKQENRIVNNAILELELE